MKYVGLKEESWVWQSDFSFLGMSNIPSTIIDTIVMDLFMTLE